MHISTANPNKKHKKPGVGGGVLKSCRGMTIYPKIAVGVVHDQSLRRLALLRIQGKHAHQLQTPITKHKEAGVAGRGVLKSCLAAVV